MSIQRLKATHAETHGIRGDKKWLAPRLVARCDADARPGYNTRKAHEYQEEPSVLRAKVRLLASMIRAARRVTAYTGAGISTASGINDYASKAKDSKALSRPRLKSPFDAQPTLAHRVMASMHAAGHLDHWVQQNHDGLPQKAGFPQHALNEIHGAWFDPSNPVVKMDGDLRDDLFALLEEEERRVDLCLALGTSLCGMNADRIPERAARRALKGSKTAGAVIVALQQTQMDSIATLRIFATIDDVMAILAEELGVKPKPADDRYSFPPKDREAHWGRQCACCGQMPIVGACLVAGKGKTAEFRCSRADCAPDSKAKERFKRVSPPRHVPGRKECPMYDVFALPYDTDGRRLVEGKYRPSDMIRLKLRKGAKVRMTFGSFTGDEGVVLGQTSGGNWVVQLKHDMTKHYHHGQRKRPKSNRTMGRWMVQAAVEGRLDAIPMVNGA